MQLASSPSKFKLFKSISLAVTCRIRANFCDIHLDFSFAPNSICNSLCVGQTSSAVLNRHLCRNIHGFIVF